MTNKNKISTQSIVLCSILAALVFILQLMGSFIKFSQFSISLVLIPIVIGSATCGIGAGTFLGLVFSIAVLISGDAAAFLAINPAGAVITVLVKGILCGFFAGVTYKLLSRFNRYIAVIGAAIVCPVVNSGIFFIGCLLFFMDLISTWAAGVGMGQNAVNYILFFLIGGNFLFELILNIILSPVMVRLLKIRSKKI